MFTKVRPKCLPLNLNKSAFKSATYVETKEDWKGDSGSEGCNFVEDFGDMFNEKIRMA